MSEEKPFGWRPFSEEDKAPYRDLGWSEEAIADLEANNIYQPIDAAILGFKLGAAMLYVAGKHLGPKFVHDVRAELALQVVKDSTSEHVEDRVEAKIVDRFIDGMDWDKLIAEVSED